MTSLSADLSLPCRDACHLSLFHMFLWCSLTSNAWSHYIQMKGTTIIKVQNEVLQIQIYLWRSKTQLSVTSSYIQKWISPGLIVMSLSRPQCIQACLECVQSTVWKLYSGTLIYQTSIFNKVLGITKIFFSPAKITVICMFSSFVCLLLSSYNALATYSVVLKCYYSYFSDSEMLGFVN